tara:strand:- start:153 stop:1142 length:990 start_codon:yes stop_codon:yes gene_type:complete
MNKICAQCKKKIGRFEVKASTQGTVMKQSCSAFTEMKFPESKITCDSPYSVLKENEHVCELCTYQHWFLHHLMGFCRTWFDVNGSSDKAHSVKIFKKIKGLSEIIPSMDLDVSENSTIGEISDKLMEKVLSEKTNCSWCKYSFKKSSMRSTHNLKESDPSFDKYEWMCTDCEQICIDLQNKSENITKIKVEIEKTQNRITKLKKINGIRNQESKYGRRNLFLDLTFSALGDNSASNSFDIDFQTSEQIRRLSAEGQAELIEANSNYTLVKNQLDIEIIKLMESHFFKIEKEMTIDKKYSESRNFCIECGVKIIPNSKFCHKCGKNFRME